MQHHHPQQQPKMSIHPPSVSIPTLLVTKPTYYQIILSSMCGYPLNMARISLKSTLLLFSQCSCHRFLSLCAHHTQSDVLCQFHSAHHLGVYTPTLPNPLPHTVSSQHNVSMMMMYSTPTVTTPTESRIPRGDHHQLLFAYHEVSYPAISIPQHS